jgi:DUF177 domain-containing protein
MYISHDVLRLNVGFVIHQTVGYSRDFPFEIPTLRLPPELELSDFTGVVRVTRTAQGLLVQAKLQARIAAECVRCLTEFQQPLEIGFSDLYAFTTASITESGLLMPENGKIDLAPIVREEMLLAFPIKPLCQPECKGLCPICGENQNETICHHGDESLQTGPGELSSMIE